MAGQEIDIMNFKNTAYYELAVKSNINGGTTLKGVEIQLFEDATEGLGLSLDSFSLDTNSKELTSKEARKNVKNQGSELDKLYKAQFGSMGKQTVESSEERALGIIETSKMSFERSHKDIVFTPPEISKRPMFTESKYTGNPTKYTADLIAWAKDVAASYDLYSKMSTEQIVSAGVNAVFKKIDQAALDIIINSNLNTERLSNELGQSANAIINELRAGTAKVINAVKNSEGHIVATVKSAAGNLSRLIIDEAGYIMDVVHFESAETRNTVRAEGAHTRNTTRQEAVDTRNTVRREGAETRNTTRQEAQETQEIETVNQAIAERLASKNASTKLAGKVSSLQQQIAESNLSHEKKMELLHELTGIAFTEQDIERFGIRVSKAVTDAAGNKAEERAKEESPYHETPYFEDPYPYHSGGNVNNGNSATAPSNDSKPSSGASKEDKKPEKETECEKKDKTSSSETNVVKEEEKKKEQQILKDPFDKVNQKPAKKVKNKKSVKDIIIPNMTNAERKEKDKEPKQSIFSK